ncbi:MAG: metallophosphoesterase [Candidatus Omnitrophica bacterium]|nr:metallophosphoesterase [Candidatus Omnitrophota bacterium]
MLVGVLSDTHDNLDQVEKARRVFEKRDVGAIFHCGDFITPIVFDVLQKFPVSFFGVFGNNDYKEALGVRSRFQIKEEPHRMEFAGRKIFLCHHRRYLEKLSEGNGDAELVLYGETHEPEVRRCGKQLIVNPGETCGWVTGTSTIAVVDLQKLDAEILRLDI